MKRETDNNMNFLIAAVLSVAILLGFNYFLPRFMPISPASHDKAPTVAGATPGPGKPVTETPLELKERASLIAEQTRLRIETPQLKGSINLKGARFDDLALVRYPETIDPQSPPVILLSPAGAAAPNMAYYADLGWLGETASIIVPGDDTEWKADSDRLTPDHPVTLSWANGQGLSFERHISVDDKFLFTITDSVHNSSVNPVTLYASGVVARQGDPVKSSSNILHEGPLGVVNGTLEEYKYKKLMDIGKKTEDSQGGWIGITDKYWLVAIAPQADEKLSADFAYNRAGQTDPMLGWFQTDFRSAPVTIGAGDHVERQVFIFAGAKQQNLLETYEKDKKIPLLDRAIDFGWFWFLTIPFLHLLNFLSGTLHSYALAILTFTVMLKLLTLPLSLKSNHSMSRMKILQPEMKRLQERYKDDKVKQSQEMMALYKREGVSPVSGCVPTLIQIPIFFALYKVLYVGIEMRQAPFYGWVHDLSMPDPSSIFTLFGAIPWSPPAALQIGVWPLLMGCSMFLQQRLSPQPPDKSQARMFTFMPIIFTYLLRNMPAGLVIYWTWSNLLSILQQWFIMRQDAKRKARA